MICMMLFNLVPSAYSAARPGWDLSYPTGMATDGSGKLYVTDYDGQRVQIYNNDESLYLSLGVKGESGSDNSHFNTPNSVTVDRANGDIYVLDANNKRIQVFDSQGSRLRTIAIPSPYNVPQALTVDGYGHVIVTDQNNAILRMDTDGGHFRVLDNAPDRPMGVAADSHGNLYVTQYWQDIVIVYRYNSTADTYAAPETIIGVKGVEGADNTHLKHPYGIYIDSHDRLYVADTDNNRVQVYNSGGSYARTLTGVIGPRYLAADSDGNVYVADSNNKQIFKFDGQGKFVKILGQVVNSTIDPSTASFDKYAASGHYADVSVTLTLNGNALTELRKITSPLTKDEDYTVSGDTVTIKKAYLATLPLGKTTLSFVFNAGATQPLTINVSDSTPQVATVSYAPGDHGTIGATSEQVTLGGHPAAVPTVTPENGYHFAGWSSDGGNTKLSSEQVAATTVTADITYTAYYSLYVMGDANGDGSVTTADALILTQYIKGKITLTAEQLQGLDMNGDGQWNEVDVKAILAICAGKG